MGGKVANFLVERKRSTMKRMGDPTTELKARRAAVVCRHPATQRAVTQALGVAGLGVRQVISPQLLPRSSRGEFELVVLDLDLDPHADATRLVDAVGVGCPDTPVVCLAGVSARMRLVEALERPTVAALLPKLGSWLDAPGGPPVNDGPDEQELALTLRRIAVPAPLPHGPAPYLLGGTVIEERLIASTAEKEEALQGLLALAGRLGLSDEKLRRVEVAADELLLNAIWDAPRDGDGRPRFAAVRREARGAAVSLSAKEQVRFRFATDGRALALSVHDRFGSLTRKQVANHVARVLEPGGPRPRPVGTSETGGAGLGLVLTFGAANQLAVHAVAGKFTELTAVIHIAGSNRTSLARGSSLHLYF
jgi:hypothetical protein